MESEKTIHLTPEEYGKMLLVKWAKGFFSAIDTYSETRDGVLMIGRYRPVSEAKEGILNSLGLTLEDLK